MASRTQLTDDISAKLSELCRRINKLIPLYESIGSVNVFMVSLKRQLVTNAETAMRLNDIASMHSIFKQLSRFDQPGFRNDSTHKS